MIRWSPRHHTTVKHPFTALPKEDSNFMCYLFDCLELLFMDTIDLLDKKPEIS